MREHSIRAAQYLRMSTEHQQYSLLNQSAIADYAKRNGFMVVKSYEDSGRSGLVLRERPGLRELLKDVTTQQSGYQAILVYDVSRWGRFQDTDEAASYEFLCKTAGIPVHSCAEQFANDLSFASSMMKALKRTMAAEFSRELGIKTYEGQKRLAQLGFKAGGAPGYGMRRMLVSPAGKQIRILRTGEQNAVTTDRVVLVPGPKNEVAAVRLIYRLLLGGMRPSSIARELNRRSIEYSGNRPWNFYVVIGILRNPKYAGCNVWGQTSQKLHSRCKLIPRSDWITSPGAFIAIVDTETFDRAQEILGGTTINKSDTELIEDLKLLFKKRKRLSQTMIDKSRQVASVNTYCRRFGSLREAYRLVGYKQWDEYFNRRDEQIGRNGLGES